MTAILMSNEAAREALRQAAAALDLAEAGGRPYQISLALTRIARCYQGLGAGPSAEVCLDRALRWARSSASTDSVVDLLCKLCDTCATLAEAQDAVLPSSGHAARERARDHAFEASALANRVADPGWECKVLLQISDVLDRCGDRDDAVLLQTRALRLMGSNPAGGRPDPQRLPSLGRLADS